MPEELIVASILEKMHWTYEEYLSQPVWVIQTLVLKWNEESIYLKEQQNKNAK